MFPSREIGRSQRSFILTALRFVFGIVEKISAFNAEYKLKAARYRSRKELLELDERMLRDIGVSRGDAIEEGNRGFWD